MKDSKPSFQRYGERAILMQWEPKIDENRLHFMLRAKKIIQKKYDEEIVEVIHTYNSLLIKYKFTIKNIYDEISVLLQLFSSVKFPNEEKRKRFHLPVCYDEKFGLDLDYISMEKKLLPEEIIHLHSSQIYTLYFMGFLPGFLYLGTVEKKLRFPRKKQPRKQVQKGAVGIAENQTGIYPKSSPGGWQIIGNCPLDFFHPGQNPPGIFFPGDQIRFYPVSLEEHHFISEEVKAGKFHPKIEIYGD